MNWDHLEGQWKQQRGRVALSFWGKTKNDGLAAITDKYEEHVGRLHHGRYRIAKVEDKREVDGYAIHTSTTMGLRHGSPRR
jgi:hypothetical protein